MVEDTSNRKPWLKYEKVGATTREFHTPVLKPRELFWARLWLVFSGHLGGHQIYLGNSKSALKWLAGSFTLFIAAAILLEMIVPDIDHNKSVLIPILVWFVAVAFEYRRLPKLVKSANLRMFGQKAEHDPVMRGEIGPYSRMRPIVFVYIILAVSGFAVSTFFPDTPYETVSALVMFAVSFLAFLQFTKIQKKIRQERYPND